MIYITDEFLGFMELKQDLLYQKISTEKIPYYVRESLKIGKHYSGNVPNKPICQLLEEARVKIKREQDDGNYFKVKFRAQFETDSKGNNQIIIYQQSVSELARANSLSYQDAEEIVLSHEYFHFLEYQQPKTVAEQLDTIETFRMMNLSRKARVQRTSEISANAFAKAMLDLEYLPNFYDYVYLNGSQENALKELRSDYQTFSKIFEK